MMGRTILQFFGIMFAVSAFRALQNGDRLEALVTALLGVAALCIGIRGRLTAEVLPALRGLSLTALAVAGVNFVLPREPLPRADAWWLLAWAGVGLIGIWTFIRDERALDT